MDKVKTKHDMRTIYGIRQAIKDVQKEALIKRIELEDTISRLNEENERLKKTIIELQSS